MTNSNRLWRMWVDLWSNFSQVAVRISFRSNSNGAASLDESNTDEKSELPNLIVIFDMCIENTTQWHSQNSMVSIIEKWLYWFVNCHLRNIKEKDHKDWFYFDKRLIHHKHLLQGRHLKNSILIVFVIELLEMNHFNFLSIQITKEKLF